MKKIFCGEQVIEEIKRTPARSLAEMLSVLIPLPMEAWYGYAFSQDPLHGRFTEAQKKCWMEQAIACGIAYAKRLVGQYQTRDPKEMAELMGLEVEYPELPDKTDRVLFAEFREPNKIRIFKDAVRRSDVVRNIPEVSEWLTEQLDVERVLLAHEIFHYVEEIYKKEIFTKKEKIRLWSLGLLHNDSTILSLGEIAAMAFAKELTGMDYAPYVLDVVLVYGYAPEEADALYEEILSYGKK